MGIIQNAVNQILSGTAVIAGKGQQRKEAAAKAAAAAEKAAQTKESIIRQAYQKNAKKGWETRRANQEAKMKDSLMEKAAAKKNGRDTVKRLKGEVMRDVI